MTDGDGGSADHAADAPTPGVSGPGSVSIVVVNWNGRDILEGCLSAVLAQDYEGPFEIVLVDNLSTDDSVAFVREHFPQVRVLENTENNYAGANNLGVASSDSEYVVCLNTDTRAAPDWLRQLVACAASDPSIGAVTPLVVFESGAVNSAGIMCLDGFHWRDRGLDAATTDGFETGEVAGVSGCAPLYRRRCWEEVGGLDEDFHMYYEDVDMSLRCRAAGWRLMLCAEARITHMGHASIHKLDAMSPRGSRSLKDDLGERNRLFVIARHFPEVLGEHLLTSRFVLHANDRELLDGIGAILDKWEAAALVPLARDQFEAMVLSARATILDREAWARQASMSLIQADAATQAARHAFAGEALRAAADRDLAHARTARLEQRIRSHESALERARAQIHGLCQRATPSPADTLDMEQIRHELEELRRLLDEPHGG